MNWPVVQSCTCHTFFYSWTYTHTHTYLLPYRITWCCIWKKGCMSVIIFTNFSQTALLLHRFLLIRLCYLVLMCLVLADIIMSKYWRGMSRASQPSPAPIRTSIPFQVRTEQLFCLGLTVSSDFQQWCWVWNHIFAFEILLKLEGWRWVVGQHFGLNIFADQLSQ